MKNESKKQTVDVKDLSTALNVQSKVRAGTLPVTIGGGCRGCGLTGAPGDPIKY